MIAMLARTNPHLAITIRPVAAALQVDPDVLAALYVGIGIAGDIAQTMSRAEAVMAATDDDDADQDQADDQEQEPDATEGDRLPPEVAAQYPAIDR